MKNFVQEGKVLEHVLAADVVSGAVVVLPAGIGVATKSGVIGDKVNLLVEGVVKLPKKAATVMAFGAKVAWDASPGEITTTLADGVPCGIVSQAALSADAEVEVKLLQSMESSGQAASVAALGVTSDLVGVDGAGSNAAPLVGTEARLDALDAKVDEVIAALKAASLMAT